MKKLICADGLVQAGTAAGIMSFISLLVGDSITIYVISILGIAFFLDLVTGVFRAWKVDKLDDWLAFGKGFVKLGGCFVLLLMVRLVVVCFNLLGFPGLIIESAVYAVILLAEFISILKNVELIFIAYNIEVPTWISFLLGACNTAEKIIKKHGKPEVIKDGKSV